MPNNDQIVRRFFAAVSSMNAHELIEFFTPDAVYVSVPLPPPAQGRTAIFNSLVGMPERFQAVEMEIVQQVTSADRVATECIAHLTLDAEVIALPMASFFQLENSLIKTWREYFDIRAFKTRN